MNALTRRIVFVAALLAGFFVFERTSRPQGKTEVSEGPRVSERLTSRQAPAAATLSTVKVGEEIRTGAGQKRRVLLEGGVNLYVNANTQVKYTALHELDLAAGEIYVDIPRRSKAAETRITTRYRDIRGGDGAWAVRGDQKGTEVTVTRGAVTVVGDGRGLAMTAGQRLGANRSIPESLPRASHVLEWTRELMAAAASPLVPASQHAGGAIVAVDAQGQDAKITLRKFHVDVHIEDDFARTTIDQTYFNEGQVQLEGTFYFPLPPDASLSRLAMYVDGVLMEGGMAERDYARSVYETIRYANLDPALLEWVDGSTFKMRVFPLEPRTEKRVVLSYSQKLSTLYGRTQYRLPAGHSLQKVNNWSMRARIKHASQYASIGRPAHPVQDFGSRVDGDDAIVEGAGKDVRFDRDMVLELTEKTRPEETARFSSAIHDGSEYLMVRFRPTLQIKNPKVESKDRLWLFLFESSGDRDPLLGRAQIEIIKGFLTHAGPADQFLVAAANTRVRFHAAKPQAATQENIQTAIEFLDNAHLIGALDMGQAFAEITKVLPKQRPETYVIHVGSGIPAMGERRDDVLAKGLPEGTRYVGVGVGRRWNRSLMKAAAEKTGGHFTQINPDEPISWRAFDLFATLHTPRLMNIDIDAEDGQTEYVGMTLMTGRPRFQLFNQGIAQGEEICAITRVGPVLGHEKTQRNHKFELPSNVRIKGTLAGKPVEYVLKVADVTRGADYLPRTWAKLEIDRLLAQDAVEHKNTIIDLSKKMYVMTPFTSLLVLEHEDQYVQYKVDRGRRDHWAMYDCPAKIPVVYEPEPGQPDPRKWKGKPPIHVVAQTITGRTAPRLLADQGKQRSKVEQLLRQAREEDPPLLGGTVIDLYGWSGYPVSNLPEMVGEEIQSMLVSPQNLPVNFETGLRTSNFFRRSGAVKRVVTDASFSMRMALSSNETEVVDEEIVARLLEGVPERLHRKLREEVLRPMSSRTLSSGMNEFTYYGLVKAAGIFDPEPLTQKLFASGLKLDATSRVGEVVILSDGDERSYARGKSRDPVSHLLYQRPDYSGDDRLFHDLVAYAPGMSSSRADLAAVLEAEALPLRSNKLGQIDGRARELLDKARLTGWHTFTLPAEGSEPGFTISFDDKGRYAYERVLSPGIKEQMVCDGKTMLHLYPQLHIGATRQVSRAHRVDFAGLVPWALPAAEDLARGADLKMVGERTLAIVPHLEEKWRAGGVSPLMEGKGQKPGQKPAPGDQGADSPRSPEWFRVQLVFAEDGRLVEKQVVRLPKNEVIIRQILGRDGTIRVIDEKGKELAVRKGKLTPTEKSPDLNPETKHLVVLPLPYRTPQHIQKTLNIEKKNVQDLRLAEALPLFAAHVGAGNASEALAVFQRCFHAREQRQLGYYVLLASCGVNLDAQNADVFAEHLDDPLAQYLALHSSPVLRKHASQWAVSSVWWSEGVLQHLAATHALYQRWQNDKITRSNADRFRAERSRALDYVKKQKNSIFGWCLLGLMEDRAAETKVPIGELPARFGAGRYGPDKEVYRELADAFRLFEDHPDLGYAARYEHARCLYKSGQVDEARNRFRELYAKTFQEEVLPAIDGDFRQALLGDGEEKKDWWGEVLLETGRKLIEQKRRPAVLSLAWQCWQLGDAPLANSLFALALDRIADPKEKTAMTLAGIDFLWQTNQVAQGDELLDQLSKHKDLVKQPGLWRLAAKFAEHRDMSTRRLDSLEKALDTEFQKLPDVLDLQEVRREYGQLLDHYHKLADAMVTLKVPATPEFLAKVVRTADRWRALDREQGDACTTAAGILRRLGQRELAWDYLTTPVGLKPAEAEPWLTLGSNLQRKGELELADRAYLAAFQAEPTNAQILWDRAQNLRQAGKTIEAQSLIRRIAEGTWQPRFQGVQNQARLQVQGK